MKVPAISGDLMVELLLGAVVLGAAWYALHKVSGVVSSVAGGVVDAAGAAATVADNGFTSVVTGIGGAVGITDTNTDACTQALREGRTWDASFACPAKVFLSYLAGNNPQQDYNWQAHGAR